MIRVDGVNKSFGDNHVLKDINVEFQQGKINQIIGKSGSGKSVLAKCIVGLHDVDSGNVFFDDQSFTSMDRMEKKDIRRQIGMLFQGSALFDSLTVEQNVMFPLKMFANLPQSEMLDRVNFCLEHVKIEGKNELFPSELSGGMQKRVGLARAIAMNPQYLFCDEPNSGLDPQTAIVIDNLIQELTDDFNMTTIVITHDMNSVMEIGDNIIFIHDGRIWWQGDRKDILYTENKELNEFVYASSLMEHVKEALKGHQ